MQKLAWWQFKKKAEAKTVEQLIKAVDRDAGVEVVRLLKEGRWGAKGLYEIPMTWRGEWREVQDNLPTDENSSDLLSVVVLNRRVDVLNHLTAEGWVTGRELIWLGATDANLLAWSKEITKNKEKFREHVATGGMFEYMSSINCSCASVTNGHIFVMAGSKALKKVLLPNGGQSGWLASWMNGVDVGVEAKIAENAYKISCRFRKAGIHFSPKQVKECINEWKQPQSRMPNKELMVAWWRRRWLTVGEVLATKEHLEAAEYNNEEFAKKYKSLVGVSLAEAIPEEIMTEAEALRLTWLLERQLPSTIKPKAVKNPPRIL